jgi:hypothetical protein
MAGEKKVAPRKLDRNKPFGEIYGTHAARFEQHGIQFDADGLELPGFETVKIPDAKVEMASNEKEVKKQFQALQAELDRVQGENASMQAKVEEAEALVEELQGQLDTAMVEISRLNETIAGMSSDNASDPINQQLDLQGKVP